MLNFLTSWEPFSFARTRLQGVSKQENKFGCDCIGARRFGKWISSRFSSVQSNLKFASITFTYYYFLLHVSTPSGISSWRKQIQDVKQVLSMSSIGSSCTEYSIEGPLWAAASSLSRFHDHAWTHHTRQDSSGRVIGSTQRNLLYGTQ